MNQSSANEKAGQQILNRGFPINIIYQYRQLKKRFHNWASLVTIYTSDFVCLIFIADFFGWQDRTELMIKSHIDKKLL